MTMILDGTLGITATGSLTGLTTAITPAQGGTGLTAVGSSGNLLTSNGTAWTSTAPASSGPTVKYVTNTTDIPLVDIASSQVNVGTSFSVSIPTTGFINIRSFAGRITYSSGAAETALVLGIRISSTNYWLGTTSQNGTPSYAVLLTNSSSAGYDEYYGQPRTRTTVLTNGMAGLIADITANSIPTGTQTVQLIAAALVSYSPGLGILKGTTTTTRVAIEFVTAS